MGKRSRQIVLSILLIIATLGFAGGGYYLMKNPIEFPVQTPDTLIPDAVYEPYKGVEPGADEAPTGNTDEQPAAQAAEVAVEQQRFYTTKRATVFTFSGFGNIAELNGVLEALRRTDSTATFFVTDEEMDTCADQIRTVRNAGHSLGISMPPNAYSNASEMQSALIAQRTRLMQEYGVTEQVFVRPTYGSSPQALLQAAGACGMQVLTQILEAVPSEVSRMTDVDEVVSAIISEDDGAFQRGEIVHFQMGLIQHSDRLLGELVEKLVTENCVYPVMSAADIASDIASLYTYPLPESEILPEVLDKIQPGHLAGKSDEELFEAIRTGYLGIDWVNTKGFLPGFTSAEIGKLDRKGLIRNDNKYVFLTFDDWGTDGTVEKLLTVLKKHGAKATFFVRTQYVQYNPNLLRGIAAEGHTIADHTHQHLPLANEITGTKFEELSDAQAAELAGDLVTSYQTLQSIVGDLRDAYGVPSLSLLFRPPTLAVGRNGLQTVFDCGFIRSISGYYTSSDYKAESAEKLAAELKKKMISGAVIVMHFSDTAIYTADALDICLTQLEQENKGLQFVGLNAVYGASGSTLPQSYSALTVGSKGESVRRLQQALIDRGYLAGKADGIFGNKTANAVKQAQADFDMPQNSIADEAFQKKLYGDDE